MSGDEQDDYQFGSKRDANGKRDYDMLIGGWESDYPDLNGNIEIMFASNQATYGYNAAGYVNRVIDQLIIEQLKTSDPVQRFNIQKRMIITSRQN